MHKRQHESKRETPREEHRGWLTDSLSVSHFLARAGARARFLSLCLFLFFPLSLSDSHSFSLSQREVDREAVRDSARQQEHVKDNTGARANHRLSRALSLSLTFSCFLSLSRAVPPRTIHPLSTVRQHTSLGNGFRIHTNTELFPVEYRARFDERDQNIYKSGCTRERARSRFL